MMKAVTAMDDPTFCPHCAHRLTEVLTSSPAKCPSCRLPLGVNAWTPIDQWHEVRKAQQKLRERAAELGDVDSIMILAERLSHAALAAAAFGTLDSFQAGYDQGCSDCY
jgi:ribosomal protein L37AE/L43A